MQKLIRLRGFQNWAEKNLAIGPKNSRIVHHGYIIFLPYHTLYGSILIVQRAEKLKNRHEYTLIVFLYIKSILLFYDGLDI